MKLDQSRKAKLKQCIGEVKTKYTRDWIYLIGLVAILRDDQYDARVTCDELKSMLADRGTDIQVYREKQS